MLPRSLIELGARSTAAAQNALEVVRYGGLETGEEPSPFELATVGRAYRLRHYYPGEAGGPPVLLVAPQMLSADVYDVSTAASAVTMLRRGGIDPWVIDFGRPEEQPDGTQRTLSDLVLAISEAIDRVRADTGQDVTLGGYSQGGLLVYQTAAYRRTDGLTSVITFGSPLDMRGTPLAALPDALMAPAARALADTVLSRAALPGWFTRTAFRMVDPVKTVRGRLDFVLQIHDRDALIPRERQRRFIESDGWVTWPGPALADMMRQFVAHNRLLKGGFVLGDRTLTLADISCPILTFIADADILAPGPSVRAIANAAPAADVYEATIPAGHFGLVVGSGATRKTWPLVIDWIRWATKHTELPEAIRRSGAGGELEAQPETRVAVPGADLVLGAAGGAARALVSSGADVVRGTRALARETAATLPRLSRLESLDPGSRVSMGQLIDEQATRRPDQIFFLFEDRAHTYLDANRRIDAIVRGLISLGLEQGDHVGVLMHPRPSALCLTAAISRLGAVGVLLRPGAWVSEEAALAGVECIIADPEHVASAAQIEAVPVFALGGGPDAKALPAGIEDMEAIDPAKITVPRWYRPNPGRAQDPAFILFSGSGSSSGDDGTDGMLRAKVISNGRWSLSAFGAASAAALSERDTVYAVAPLYHASGLLMSIGGAIAGGARLAMTARYEPATFWQEVRRYGVTVASYTWAGLHEITAAPAQSGERHHSVRLFFGSGMPSGLWERVERRFAPARVLEFYAATEADVILANVRGQKRGSLGRPLPGSAPTEIVAWDVTDNQLVRDHYGLGTAVAPGEVGMLVASVSPQSFGSRSLRGLFAPSDAWLPTGDLFRRDADGDYWLVDNITTTVRTERGPIFVRPITHALARLPAVDLAFTYAFDTPSGDTVAITAVMLQNGAQIDAGGLDAALATLPAAQRPDYVRIVDELPMTTWYRPVVSELRAQGLGSDSRPVWGLAAETGGYRELLAAGTALH